MKSLQLLFVSFLFACPVWAEEPLIDINAALIPLSLQQIDNNVVFQGKADKTPWAGYSFPVANGGLQKPLTVYDKYTDKKAGEWEKQNLKEPKTYNSAWAAASVLESEPTGKDSKIIEIRKGLFAGIYDSDNTIKLAGGDKTTNKCTPKSLWLALRNNIDRFKNPVIICLDGANDDDNHVVFAYGLTCELIKDTDMWKGEFSLFCIADTEKPSENPTRKLTLYFTGKIKDRTLTDDGEWTGKVRPSYVWIANSPGDKVRNEQINVPEVRKILSLPDEELVKYLPVSQETPQESEPQPSPDKNNGTKKPDSDEKTPDPDDGGFIITPNPNKNSDKPQTIPPKPMPERPKHESKMPVYLSVDEMLALLSNKISSWKFDASIPQKFDFGSKMNVGENFKVSIKSEQSGYMYIIAVNSEGDLSMIYPIPGENNYYSGTKPVLLPRDNRSFQISEHLPPGEVRLKVFLTGAPVHISGAGNFEKILLRKSTDQTKQAEQIIETGIIDPDETDIAGIFGDDDEVTSTCFLTRRIRMARQQRRYVINCLRKYPCCGEVVSPVTSNPISEESNTEPVAEEPQQESPKPFMEQPDKEPQPEPITEKPQQESESKPFMEQPDKEPQPEPEPIAEKPQQESESNPFMEQPDKEPQPEPVAEKPKPESESKPFLEQPDKESEPELIAEKPQPESESNLFMKQPDKESKQKPVVEKQKQESESKSNKRTKQNSQQESIAEKRKQKLPPSVVQTNEYFDTVNRNMRKLLHGFAQDEVLIINTGKTK